MKLVFPVLVFSVVLLSCSRQKEGREAVYKVPIDKLIEEVWNHQRLEVLPEVFTNDAVLHIGGTDSNIEGIANFKENYMQLIMAAFPDIQHGYDKLLVDGNIVVMMFYGEGTHNGEYAGVPATNKHLRYQGLALFRMQDDKIAEVWTYSNWASKFSQLHSSEHKSEIDVNPVKMSLGDFDFLLNSNLNQLIKYDSETIIHPAEETSNQDNPALIIGLGNGQKIYIDSPSISGANNDKAGDSTPKVTLFVAELDNK